jgi:DNA topoisomerase-6 subunit B
MGLETVDKLDSNVEFLRLSVRDNGIGIEHHNIPFLFGRVLTGSNYGARQTRGRFGLGAKMVLLNAMATVDLPILIKSRYHQSEKTSVFLLFIDLAKNEPIIVFEEQLDPGAMTFYKGQAITALNHPGTEVSVTFTGSWRYAKKFVRNYFHQLFVITPYADFKVQFPDEPEPLDFERIVDDLPPSPKTVQIHHPIPSGAFSRNYSCYCKPISTLC